MRFQVLYKQMGGNLNTHVVVLSHLIERNVKSGNGEYAGVSNGSKEKSVAGVMNDHSGNHIVQALEKNTNSGVLLKHKNKRVSVIIIKKEENQ